METTMSTGTVDYFHKTSGYGFIESTVTDEDIFFHMNEVGDEDPIEGQRVQFEYKSTDKGPRATTLSIIPESEKENPSDTVEAMAKNKTENNDGSNSLRDNSSILHVSSKDKEHHSQNLDPESVERELEVGDLVYLKLTHKGNSLGNHNPLRETFTLLLGNGICPELEEDLIGSTVGKTGQFEVSTIEGTVRAPPRSVDQIDTSWVATLAEDAGVNTLQGFVDASGETLTETELLDATTLREIQASFEQMVEDWELIEYQVIHAVSWREI